MALAHTGQHIRNYFAPPSWYRTPPNITRLPSPPPSSTDSTTTATAPESVQTTSSSLESTELEERENQVRFTDSLVKFEYKEDFGPLQNTEQLFEDKFTRPPYKRRASGLDMDLMMTLSIEKDEIEVKPPVWPETLTHLMGCGELAIGILINDASDE